MKRGTRQSVLLLVVTLVATVLAPLFAIAEEPKSDEPVAQEAKVSPDQQWGHLSGRFTYDGKPPEVKHLKVGKNAAPLGLRLVDERLVVNAKNRGIADIAIFLHKKKRAELDVHPACKETAHDVVDIVIQGDRFDPHMQLVRAGQTLRVTNRNNIVHNVNTPFLKNKASSLLIAPDRAITMQITKAERLPTSVIDDMRPWMKGMVLVMDHPYMAKTDADGRFEIKNLPVGEHTFRLWHKQAGYMREIRFGTDKEITFVKRGLLTVTIKPGENDQGDFHVPPSLFKK